MEKPTVQNLLPIQICTFITIRQKFKLKLKIKQIIISRLKDERQFDFHVLLLSSSSFYYTWYEFYNYKIKNFFLLHRTNLSNSSDDDLQ